MSASYDELAHDKRLMAHTAAAMFGGATVDAAIEGIVPGDPAFAIAPALVGARARLPPAAPRTAPAAPALAMLGPIGVLLIAAALATTPGAGDGAILYVWPVLWTTFFFGPRGGVAIVCFVGLAHAGTLLVLPAASSYPGRWLDVMVSASVLVVVTVILVRRNRELLAAARQRGQDRRADGAAEPARLRRARRDRADTGQA